MLFSGTALLSVVVANPHNINNAPPMQYLCFYHIMRTRPAYTCTQRCH
jgi:hypothetical protein